MSGFTNNGGVAKNNAVLAGSARAGAGGPPFYVSRTDTNAVAVVNKAPVILKGPNGAGNTWIDPELGNCVLRVTDFNTGGASGLMNTSSFAGQGIWNSDSTIFSLGDNGGATHIFQLTPSTSGCGLTATLKTPTGGFPNVAVGLNYNMDLHNWGNTFANRFSIFGMFNNPAPQRLWRMDVKTSATTWDATAFTPVALTGDLKSSTCLNGLADKYMGPRGSQGISKNDDVAVAAFGLSQDNQFLVVAYTISTNTCSVINTKTGQYYLNGVLQGTWNFPMTPKPSAPTLTATTGGSLAAGTYDVCLTNTSRKTGETDCSVKSTITLAGANNAISVTNPGQVAAIYPSTGVNVWACTPSPCTMRKQSPIVAQPAAPTVTATPTGATTVNYQIVWKHANGSSVESPIGSVLSNDPADLSATVSNVVSWAACPGGATGVDVYRDGHRIGANLACTPTSLTDTGNNNLAAEEFFAETVKNDQATLPTITITSLLTGTVSAPTQSTVGFLLHAASVDTSGVWVTFSPGSSLVTAGGAVGDAAVMNLAFWKIGTSFIIPCTINTFAGATDECGGHGFNGSGTLFNNSSSVSDKDYVFRVLDSGGSVAATQKSKIHLVNQTPFTSAGGQDDHSGSTVQGTLYPAFMNSYTVANGFPNVPVRALEEEVYGVTANPSLPSGNVVYRFARTFTNVELPSTGIFFVSGIGNVSPDGLKYLFTSNMQNGEPAGTGPGSGTGVGSSTGATTCTRGTDCARSVYLATLQ